MILRNLSLLIISFLLWSAAYGQTTFTQITDHPIVDLMEHSHGMAWGDFDDDGDEDLFLSNFSDANRFFRNDGGGVFVEINPEDVFDKLNASTISMTATWGDYDNDGDLDLYIANRLVGLGSNEKKNYIYDNDGDGTFTQVANELFTPTNNSYGVAWADYNLDGNLDAAEVSSPSAYMHLFENTGASDFTRINFGVNNASANGLSWADYDNDGYPELFVAAENENFLFDNDGSALTQVVSGPVGADDVESYGGSWADYDNDGDMDLFVANGGTADEPNSLFRNDNGSFTKITSGEIVTDTERSRGSAWGDYDNDGFLDLIVINDGAANSLYKNNGDGTFAKITGQNIVTLDGYGRSCSWIDYNQDGFLDLYSTDFDVNRENVLFENDGNANHWTTVKLKGTVSNSAAIGAKVKVYAEINGTDTWLLREISSQTGFAAQAGLFAHFGLGDAATIDSLIIEWPSGIVQRHAGMTVDQMHVITEILPPAAPSDLQATALSFSEIDIAWTDNAGNENGYIVERSIGDNLNFTAIANLPADAESYSDDGLTGNTTYFYRVKAENESGPVASGEVSATTDPAPVDAPSDLAATANSPVEIGLSWTDNSDNETGFILERTTGTDPPVIVNIAADETTYTDTDNLQEDTEYQYRIKAASPDGESTYSNTVDITTPPFILAPGSLTGNALSHDEIELSWSDNSDNETGFVIERSLTAGSGFAAIHTTAADETAYTDTDNLDPLTEYYYRVKAVNATHESKYSDEASSTTPEYTPVVFTIPDLFVQPAEEIAVPLAVENFADVLTAQFTVTWDPAVLDYMGVEDEALTDMNFGETDVSTGTLTFSWNDPGGTPQDLPDGTALFSIRFEAIGADETDSPVEIPVSGPTPLELGNGAAEVMDVETNAGTIGIQTLVALSGTIRNANGDEVANAEITLSGDDIQSEITGTDGSFSFNVAPGSAVAITPKKDTEPVVNNGISTLDIALIRRHIISPLKLSDPYQLIAADVNNSASVSTIDIGMIRDVVLTKKTSFDNTHWKFVPTTFVFADENNPFPYDEQIAIGSAVNQSDLDFTGVRLGDVNYSWDKTKARKTSGEILEIELPEQKAAPGELISVPLTVKNFKDISAFQFTVKWDKKSMEFVEISQNPLTTYFSDHKAAEGYLTVAWDETSGASAMLEDGKTLIELAFKIKGLADETTLEINSELTQSIAYNGELEEVTINSNVGKVSLPGFNASDKVVVHQNYPNPFGANGTKFGFELPEEAHVKIIIFNAIGKAITVLEQNYSAGSHKVKWLPSQKLANGLYFYTIESNGFSITKRMIKKE